MMICLLTAGIALADNHWVGTWGTAPQLVETNNNPPSPGLTNNSLRQIVQVSIGGEKVRLKLTNEFSSSSTVIKGVELAIAKTSGSTSEIDESTTVSLTFNGQPGVTMAAKGKAVSDAVNFQIGPRENVAITIHYGQTSSSISGHPGSRTTSYLKSGNTTDFSNAVRTDHWYNILALEVEAPETAGAVAILGNSITDGRGSTTNLQNRWADVLSRRLLANDATKEVGVLNMGIGGNLVNGNGLGPAGKDRYPRDLFGQEGVKWIILFEGTNDLGYSGNNGVQAAKNIIETFKKITREAHQKGIYVFGGTITPFKGSSHYSENHEQGRLLLNQWIRTTKMLDGVIDFDRAVRNPQDTACMQSQFLFENDWLHLNAQGYETMGGCVDLNLFTKTDPVSTEEDPEEPYDDNALWIEAEALRTNTVGTAFQVVNDGSASGGKYLKTVKQTATSAPTDSIYMLATTFTTNKADIYYIYARVNCPTYDDDSYYWGIDEPFDNNRFANGIVTSGWEWKLIGNKPLQAGQHKLVLGGREDGACIDKLCITINPEAPSGMGGNATAVKTLHAATQAAFTDLYSLNGMRLTAQQSQGPCIAVSRAEDGAVVARKVVGMRNTVK